MLKRYYNTTKKFFILFILIFSTMAFAVDLKKEKKFESWTLTLYEQQKTLRIVNSDDKISVPKEWAYKDESSEKKSGDSKPKSINDLNAKNERVVVDCTKVTDIHGKMENLESIYNSLNSASDCKNLDLRKMGFETAAAASINRNQNTGKITSYLDLIIIDDDIEDE